MNRQRWLIVAGVAIVVILIVAFARGRGTPVQYFTAKVDRGEIRDVVEATGTVNAVVTGDGDVARLGAKPAGMGDESASLPTCYHDSKVSEVASCRLPFRV